MLAKVLNLPENYRKYVVARVVDNELWFYGSWNELEPAKRCAKELGHNAIVVISEGEDD